MEPTQLIDNLLIHLTIAAQILIVVGLIQIGYFHQTQKILWRPIPNNFRLVSLYIVSTVATIGSLFYSDIMGRTPCMLCWYQRILMYPQSIMYLVAIAKNDLSIKTYGLIFSGIGAIIALYHYLLQFNIVTVEMCSAVGYSVSCSERFAASYGYITIPMMALTAFMLLIILWLLPDQKSDFSR